MSCRLNKERLRSLITDVVSCGCFVILVSFIIMVRSQAIEAKEQIVEWKDTHSVHYVQKGDFKAVNLCEFVGVASLNSSVDFKFNCKEDLSSTVVSEFNYLEDLSLLVFNNKNEKIFSLKYCRIENPSYLVCTRI